MFSFLKKQIEIKKTSEGSHGDHWNAIFGFGNDLYMQSEVKELFNTLKNNQKINSSTEIYTSNYQSMRNICVVYKGETITFFPAHMSKKSIPITLKSIVEWEHINNMEAFIEGNGKDTFMASFFAIDYAENKKKYKKGGTLNIALAGLAYVIDKNEKDAEDDEMPFSDDFCTYVPSQELITGYDYDFIGKVLSVKPLGFKNEKLFILNVQLISNPDDPNMFNLPIIVNPKNMRIDVPEMGDMISGCFWMHGRIVEKKFSI